MTTLDVRPPPLIRYLAPVTCPCGNAFTGTWYPGKLGAWQACPACGILVHTSWPGFTFRPEYVTDLPQTECRIGGPPRGDM